LLENYTLIFIADGEGSIQVDFKNYFFRSRKAIFLSPGQYLKLLYGDLKVRIFRFQETDITKTQSSRFLFKHLVGLGHIDVYDEGQFHFDLIKLFGDNSKSAVLLDNAINDWIKLNPFKSTPEEVKLIFDFKDIVDERFFERPDLNILSRELDQKPQSISTLLKDKLSHTPHTLFSNRVLLEAQRKLVFTDEPTKIIAYDTGFKDPAYFNRFFKQQTNFTPVEFRKKYVYDEPSQLLKDLFYLISLHYKTQHQVQFYANKLFVTERYLSIKVYQALGSTVKQLIFDKLMFEAKTLLKNGNKIKDIAFELGFHEPNHLTAFFRTHNGTTPSEFSAQH